MMTLEKMLKIMFSLLALVKHVICQLCVGLEKMMMEKRCLKGIDDGDGGVSGKDQRNELETLLSTQASIINPY